MFGFTKLPKEPLSEVKSAERWLACLPQNDMMLAHAELLGEISRLADRDARRTPASLEALFLADRAAEDVRKVITTQYLQHSIRSSKIEHQLWQALFDLTQTFQLAYAAFGRDATNYAGNPKWQAHLPELLTRQMTHLGLDARIRLYRHEHWIPAKWAELHALFNAACAIQVERQPVVLDIARGTTTIEHQYLTTLVLQTLNTGNLGARHLEWVVSKLDDWCTPLRLTLEASAIASFYVDLGSAAGLKRCTGQPLEGRVLFVDTRALHTQFRQSIVGLEQKIRREPLSTKTPRRSERLALMVKLASLVDPEFRPLPRRGIRTSAVGAVDAIVGFAKISSYLREEARSPIPELDPGHTYGDTMELAVFGHVRNERDRRLELARRRLDSYASPGGPWEVKDVSQSGYRLIAPMLIANAVSLGTLVAIRLHSRNGWTLGIVRRMKRLTVDRAEIGLQLIANTVVGVDLVDQPKDDDEYSFDGDSVKKNRRSFHGLFLVLSKHGRDTPVQSLILPAAEYQSTRRLRLQAAQSSYAIRFGRRIEEQPDWVWAVLEPLALEQRSVA